MTPARRAESSTRAYESRRGKPEVRGASRVTWRAFEAGVKSGHPPGKKGTRQNGRLSARRRARRRASRGRVRWVRNGGRAGGMRGRFVSERTLQFSLAGVMRGVTLSLSPAAAEICSLSGDFSKRSAGRSILRAEGTEIPAVDRALARPDHAGCGRVRTEARPYPRSLTPNRRDARDSQARVPASTRRGRAAHDAASTCSCSKPGEGAASRDLHPEHRSRKPSDRPRATPIIQTPPRPRSGANAHIDWTPRPRLVRREVVVHITP